MKVTQYEILRRAKEILAECRTLAPEHASTHDRITFRVSGRMTRAAGTACPLTGEVTLSLPFFEDRGNFERGFRNVVTHETAHILSPPVRNPGSRKRSSHGPAWRAMDRRLGGTGDRCHTLELAVGYESRKRSQRASVPCPCGCGQTMSLGPTQLKRHKARRRGEGYYIAGHQPTRKLNDFLRSGGILPT